MFQACGAQAWITELELDTETEWKLHGKHKLQMHSPFTVPSTDVMFPLIHLSEVPDQLSDVCSHQTSQTKQSSLFDSGRKIEILHTILI